MAALALKLDTPPHSSEGFIGILLLLLALACGVAALVAWAVRWRWWQAPKVARVMAISAVVFAVGYGATTFVPVPRMEDAVWANDRGVGPQGAILDEAEVRAERADVAAFLDEAIARGQAFRVETAYRDVGAWLFSKGNETTPHVNWRGHEVDLLRSWHVRHVVRWWE